MDRTSSRQKTGLNCRIYTSWRQRRSRRIYAIIEALELVGISEAAGGGIVRTSPSKRWRALALAFGLSFGLCSREDTHSILNGSYARRLFIIGQPIEIQGQRGTLKAITPTLTLLDQDGKTVSVANTVFLREAVKQ